MSNWSVKYRPRTFSEVVGQEAIVKALVKDQRSDDWSKAYMFTGPFGSGKTTLAKLIAESLVCKNRNERGEPCLECPSCRAIIDETWDRDCVYINGTSSSAEDVRRIIEAFRMTGAMRDRNKVMIIDETQGLSPEALNSLLQVVESPRGGQYFVLNAMSKLKGKDAGALESRCRKWKMKIPTVKDVYLYLVDLCKVNDVKSKFQSQGEFDTFMTEGLETIAQNCDYSYREAIQMLDQCVDAELFTKEGIKSTLDVESYEDMMRTVTDLANGNITPTVVATITGKEYQNSFGLISKILGDAAVVRACGTLGYTDEEKWKERGPRELASSPNFEAVMETMMDIAGSTSGYLPRGLWEMKMSKLVEKVKGPQKLRESEPPEGVTEAPKRRPVK